MSFAPIQKEVDEWISQFEEGYVAPLPMLARLTEEVGELARAVSHQYGGKRPKPGENEGAIGEEISDAMFVLICLANSLDINLDSSFCAGPFLTDRPPERRMNIRSGTMGPSPFMRSWKEKAPRPTMGPERSTPRSSLLPTFTSSRIDRIPDSPSPLPSIWKPEPVTDSLRTKRNGSLRQVAWKRGLRNLDW